MKNVLLVALVSLSFACKSTPDAGELGVSGADLHVSDAGFAKLKEAAEVGRAAADYPPRKDGGMHPATRREGQVDTLHGEKVPNPYKWLEDEKAPEVVKWMDAQDAHARAALAKLPGRDVLKKRFTELFYVDAISAPVRRGNRFFYARQHADKEKAIVYWREGEGAEKKLLDPHEWSSDMTVSLGVWVPSWDGKKVVFAKKPNAADESTLYVLDVDSGKVSETDVIEGAKYASPDWTPDNKGFYYEWLPPLSEQVTIADRPAYTEIRFHKLGTDPKTDEVVHPRTGSAETFLDGYLPREGKVIFAAVAHGWNETDVYYKKPTEKAWKVLVKGKETKAKYEVDAWKDNLYVMTDEGAPKNRIFKASLKDPSRAKWKEIVPEDPNAAMEGFTIVGGHLAATYLKDVVSEIRIFTLDGKLVRKVELPELGAASGLVGLQDQDEAYFAFSSFLTPRQIYKTSVKSGKSEVWASVKLPIDPSPYTVSQVFYPSKDGTKIPMFLVHRKDVKKDGSNPTLLYGYGGFNVSLNPNFRASIYPWLEAGGIYAVPNLRGGGEYGKEWHDAGKGAKKQNVFDDFIGAAEFLIKEGYTKPERLAIYGGSNGGLLVGAAMTQRPELYGAVVCGVPLLDMVRYHLFGSGKTWIPEYGSADDAEQFKTLFAYSPYHHVKDGVRYPPLLMMSSDHDDRVDPMHARKFVAAVQNAKGNTSPTWLRIERNAGHGGADQVKLTIESNADLFAFLMGTFGMKANAAAASATQK